VYTYKAIIVVITRRRDDYEKNSCVGVSSCGGGNVCRPGVCGRFCAVFKLCEAVPVPVAMCEAVPVPEAVRDVSVMSGQRVPVVIRLDRQLVHAECVRSVQHMPEAVREAVPDSMQHVQQVR